FLGIIHPLLGVSPFAFGKQFGHFAENFFFKISEGLLEFPLLNGTMNYENFAAFWFFYFGILMIPIGILVNHMEKINGYIPASFKWSYLIVVLVGVYMIPFSGMTVFMLPHAVYMVMQKKPLTT
ncbi:MAG: DUF6463 family protein, partial [Bacteroidota bacterium]